MAFEFYSAQGPPRELGRAHGAQAAERIAGFVDYLQATLRFDRPTLRNKAAAFEPLFQKYCPHLVDEVSGLAEGAGLHFHDALAVQLRGELGLLVEGGCTAFAVGRSHTADRSLLIGQNSDNPPALIDYAYVLRLIPTRGPRILMWTFGGMLGYHGLNECGVAHFANALGGGPPWKFALSHYPLKRLMLEQRSLDAVRQQLRDVPVCSHGNYVLCDGSGAVSDIELTSEGPYELTPEVSGVVVHANHFLCGPYGGGNHHALSLPDSFARQRRLQQLIAGKLGQLTLADCQRFLSDHQDFPQGICRHPHDGPPHPMLPSTGQTVASLIAEPDRGTLHVACGNPCQAAYHSYRIAD